MIGFVRFFVAERLRHRGARQSGDDAGMQLPDHPRDGAGAAIELELRNGRTP